MKKLSIILLFTSLFLFLSVCSEAPVIEFPEPTDRVVLAELFTEDG